MNNRNITINIPPETYARFEALCLASGAKKNQYGNALVQYAVAHHLLAGENFAEAQARLEAITKGLSPLPKVSLEIKAGPPSPIETMPLAAEDPAPYGKKKPKKNDP